MFHNIWSVSALSSDFEDSMTLSVVIWIIGVCILWGRVYKNLCPARISASIMVANMWKNSSKNVESHNKILCETLHDFFLRRNGSYFLNKPRMYKSWTERYHTYQSPIEPLIGYLNSLLHWNLAANVWDPPSAETFHHAGKHWCQIFQHTSMCI